MSDVIKNILDRIPYSDGAFRRRITAGSIVLITAYVGIYKGIPTGLDIEKLLMSSMVAGVIALLLIYAAGSLVEVVADAFTIKIADAYYCLWYATIHRKEKNVLLQKAAEGMLSDNSLEYLKGMPSIVINGIYSPFGKNRETLWDYFSDYGFASEINLVRRLRARNQDVLVIITSVQISMIILMIIAIYGSRDSFAAFLVYVALPISILLMLLIIVYIVIVRQSIVSMLEFKAVLAELDLPE